jgi:hypothetical protein
MFLDLDHFVVQLSDAASCMAQFQDGRRGCELARRELSWIRSKLPQNFLVINKTPTANAFFRMEDHLHKQKDPTN